MSKLVSRFLQDDAGATAIEYGLIAAFVATVLVGALSLIGTNLSATFAKVAGFLG